MVVALAGSPIRWLDDWQSSADVEAERATFVVDDTASWTAGDPAVRLAVESWPATDVSVRTVSSTGNLTDMGVTLTDVLETHDAESTLLCFQSLTVLLQYAPLEEVYQFLHTLVSHVDRTEITAHFHLHADAHDDDTVATLRPLFDRVRRDAER
ncbi:hypothetical protein JCM17092_28820 [Haloplanus litoreus]